MQGVHPPTNVHRHKAYRHRESTLTPTPHTQQPTYSSLLDTGPPPFSTYTQSFSYTELQWGRASTLPSSTLLHLYTELQQHRASANTKLQWCRAFTLPPPSTYTRHSNSQHPPQYRHRESTLTPTPPTHRAAVVQGVHPPTNVHLHTAQQQPTHSSLPSSSTSQGAFGIGAPE